MHSLVHCAGLIVTTPIKCIEGDVLEEIMTVNAFSAVELTKLLLKKFNAKSLTNIIFISSTNSTIPTKGTCAYNMSKAALDAFMKTLVLEYNNLRANSILPGYIKTATTSKYLEDEDFAKFIENSYPLGQGQTTDIANMVEFLLSDKSAGINGQQLFVDGGYSANTS